MNSKRFLIKLRYLGFRYHGVQKQPGFKSIQGKLEDAISKSLKERIFQIRFSSRTDALVSSMESYCLLMCEETCPLELIQMALVELPADIEVVGIRPVDDDYVLLKHSGAKEYHYYFCFNQQSFHPFASAFMTHIREELDVEVMKRGARLYLGDHDFKNYAYRPKIGSRTGRSIIFSSIEENTDMQASFFPQTSYVFKLKAQGFMRGQVRAMMGALFRLGKGEMTLQELENSLERVDSSFVKWFAPASGLILVKTEIQ